MNPVFPAQRRAEQFSSMVDSSTSLDVARSTAEAPAKYAELVPLVGIVTSLRATPAPEARPEFVSSLRERLMLAAETALVPDTAEQAEARQATPRRTGREKRIAAAIGGFAIVSASASMSVAAQSALPGDTLYPLKRALENIHEHVLRDADDKGATMLGNASSRLDEVDELSRSGGQDPEVIARTLQDFSDQAVEASDLLLADYAETGRLSAISELRDFTATSLAALDRLESVVPAEVRSVISQAKAVLDEIDRQARTLCPSCSALPAAVTDLTNAADLGPLYRELMDTAAGSGSASSSPSKPTRTPKAPTTAGQPATPSTEAPEAPATETPQDDPPSLTPGTDGGDDDGTEPPAGGGLSSTIKGLGSADLGDLLTGVTDTVDGLLTPPDGTKPSQ